jgi:hypothetical protein
MTSGFFMVEDPLRDAGFFRIEVKMERIASMEMHPPVSIGQKHRHLAMEHVVDMAGRDRSQLVHFTLSDQFSTHGVERGGSLFTNQGRLGLPALVRRKPADQQRDHQHHREGQQILHIGNSK